MHQRNDGKSGVAAPFDTSAWLTLRWTRGTRYFRAHLEQDLWQAWIVTHVNGGLNSPLGRARSTSPLELDAALFELAAIAKRRRLRGYSLTIEH